MKLRDYGVGILTVLFALLPFHTFLATALSAVFFDPLSAPPALLLAWKEILIVAFAVILGILVMRKEVPWPKFDQLDTVVLTYIIWAVLTGLWRWGTDIWRIVWGIKYSLFFLIFFLLVRHFPLKPKEREKLFKVILASAGLVIFFGVLQRIIPEDFLVNFGYSPLYSEFSPEEPISYCQKISFTDTCRAQSFLSGPNQFSAYLLFTLPLFFFLALQHVSDRKKFHQNASMHAFGATFFLLGLVALFFAFSRSAWGGIVVALGVGSLLLFWGQKWFRKVFWGGVVALGLVISLFLLAVPRPYAATCEPYETFQTTATLKEDGFLTRFFCRVVIRPSSSQGHFERSRDGVKHIMMHPLGTGLGDSGPASTRFYANKIGFIPESWYLQVGIDTGLPGLVLFLAILFLLGKKLLQTETWQGQALFCGLIGISIMALKLHSWESADVALSFWGACGVLLGTNLNSGFWIQVKNILWKAIRYLTNLK